MGLFTSSIALLIFCLVILLLKSGLLKSPAIIIKLSISPFNSANVCFKYFGALIFGAYMF